jgi:hypothetical protein
MFREPRGFLCGGFLRPTLTTLIVGSQGTNAKSCARILELSGGSVPFRGVGIRWSSCEGGDRGGAVFSGMVLER